MGKNVLAWVGGGEVYDLIVEVDFQHILVFAWNIWQLLLLGPIYGTYNKTKNR